MNIKYVVRFGRIEKVEILRETDKCVFIKGRLYDERKEFKRTEWQNYFDDFDSAKEFLIGSAQEEVKKLRAALERANGDLGRIKGIKPEDVTQTKSSY